MGRGRRDTWAAECGAETPLVAGSAVQLPPGCPRGRRWALPASAALRAEPQPAFVLRVLTLCLNLLVWQRPDRQTFKGKNPVI